MKKTFFVLVYLFIYHQSLAQLSYKSRYNSSVYIETFGSSPFFSMGLERVINKKPKSFTSLRGGLGVIFGTVGFDFSDTRLSIPLSLSKGYLINNLKKKIKQRVSLRCNAHPPKVVGETFFETGLAYSSLIYSSKDIRHRIYGTISIRQQYAFDKPVRTQVYYLKLSYTPYYSFYKLPNGTLEGLKVLPNSYAVVAGVSLGYSIR